MCLLLQFFWDLEWNNLAPRTLVSSFVKQEKYSCGCYYYYLCVCVFKPLYIKKILVVILKIKMKIFTFYNVLMCEFTQEGVPIGSTIFSGVNSVITILQLIDQTQRRPRNAILLCTYKVRTWKYLANSTTVFAEMLSEISITSLVLNSKPVIRAEDGHVGVGRAVWSKQKL